jgi:hypothetical protein
MSGRNKKPGTGSDGAYDPFDDDGIERSANGASRDSGEDRIHRDDVAGFVYSEPVDSGTPDADAGSDTPAGEPRRNRNGRIDGRTKAARAERGPSKAQVSVKSLDLADLLYSIHGMGALILKCPELEIDKKDADKLSDALETVNQHYGVAVDPKKAAIINLIAVSGGIYIPRLIAFAARRKTDSAARPAPVAINNRMPQSSRPMPVPSNIPTPPEATGGAKLDEKATWELMQAMGAGEPG